MRTSDLVALPEETRNRLPITAGVPVLRLHGTTRAIGRQRGRPCNFDGPQLVGVLNGMNVPDVCGATTTTSAQSPEEEDREGEAGQEEDGVTALTSRHDTQSYQSVT